MLKASGHTIRHEGLGDMVFSTGFSFVQMADTQVGLREATGGPPGWAVEKEHVALAIAEINRLKPAFAIVCGDHIQEWPDNDKEKGNRGGKAKRATQVKDVQETYAQIDSEIPLVCVCGNHDVGNRPSQATIDEYREDFGEDYFSFWIRGCKCIVVNSMLWTDDADAKEIRKAHDAWVASELASAKAEGAVHTFIFGHIPAFIDSPDEDLNHYNFEPDVRTELLEQWAAHGVSHYFCGHYHRRAGGVYKSKKTPGQTVEVVCTGAVGTNFAVPADVLHEKWEDSLLDKDTSGFTVVAVEEENVSHKWYSLNAIQAVNELSPETTKLTPDEEAERARGYRSLAREKERVDSFAQAADAREEERAGAAAALTLTARTPSSRRESVVQLDKHVYPLPQEKK